MADSTPIPARYTQASPCPVCGGWEALPRGQGRRCDGYRLTGGAYCARQQSPKPHKTAELWWHRDEKRDTGERQQSRKIVATYAYTDEQGVTLFEAVRFDPKGFAQRRPDGQGGHVWSLSGTRLVLYRLPELLAALAMGDTVYIVEGEKDANAAHEAGAVATCNPMGAGKWRDEYSEAFRDAIDVRIVADRDPRGYEHAQRVARSLEAVGATVQVLEAAEGKDLADHLGAGRSLEELRPAQLPASSPDEEPPPAGESSSDEAADERLRQILVGFSAADAFDANGRALPPPPRKWAIPQLLPLSSNGLFVGYGGLGKGLVSLTLAHHVALGLPIDAIRWPEGERPKPLQLQPDGARGVLLVGKEDDGPEMLRRVIACNAARYGADWHGELDLRELEMIRRNVQIVCLPKSTNVDDRFLRLLVERASRVPDIGWIVIDPLGRFLFRDADGKIPKFIEGEYAAAVTDFCAELAERSGACVTPVAHMSRAARTAAKEGGAAGRSVLGVPYGNELLLSWSRFSLGMEHLRPSDLEELALAPGHRWLRLGLGQANYCDPDVQVLFERIQGATRVVDMSALDLGQADAGRDQDMGAHTPESLELIRGEAITKSQLAQREASRRTGNPSVRPNARQILAAEELLRVWAKTGRAIPLASGKWRIVTPQESATPHQEAQT